MQRRLPSPSNTLPTLRFSHYRSLKLAHKQNMTKVILKIHYLFFLIRILFDSNPSASLWIWYSKWPSLRMMVYTGRMYEDWLTAYLHKGNGTVDKESLQTSPRWRMAALVDSVLVCLQIAVYFITCFCFQLVITQCISKLTGVSDRTN